MYFDKKDLIIGVLVIILLTQTAALNSPNAFGLVKFWNDLGGLTFSLIAFLFAYWLALKATKTAIGMQRRTKLAEFRQSWIRDLRDEISRFLGLTISFANSQFDDWSAVNRHMCKIELLMNRDDPRYKKFTALMGKLSVVSMENNDDTAEIEEEFIRCSQEILKAEWDRLKAELAQLDKANP